MKRKTTFVALLSQTFTTTHTFTTRSRSYSAGGPGDYDLRDEVTEVGSPLAAQVQRWCSECATPIAMMPPELAAGVCFQTTRAIYRLVEAGRIHFTDGPEGVLVCPASLMNDWAAEQSVKLLAAAPANLSQFETKRT